MQINIRRPQIRPGDLDVEVNGSGLRKGEEPFALIQFTDGPGAALMAESAADCDRIIRAAVEAKRLLAAAVVPHAFRNGTARHWDCRECGVHEDHHIDAPAAGPLDPPAEVLAKMAARGMTELTGEEPGDEGEMCTSTMPLPNGGELKCTAEPDPDLTDGGHYGPHSALGGKRRWIGTGENAHTEEGEPAFVTEISGVPVSAASGLVAG